MPLKITIEGNELVNYLKMDPGVDDSTIYTMLESAEIEAETFLNTDFSTTATDLDGVVTITPNEAPASVKEWVFNRVAHKYENVGTWVKPDFTMIQPYRVYPFRGI